MTDLFLIAHKVSGSPAFDVACTIDCPECVQTDCDGDYSAGCSECDGSGKWWIIPTSGHRAYPWWCIALKDLQMGYIDHPTTSPTQIKWDAIDWASYPDHYTTTYRHEPKVSLADRLGLTRRPPPSGPFPRRI